MLSIADVPFKFLTFKGIICVLIIGNKEFRFTTYNNTKLIKCENKHNTLNIILKRNSYQLNIKSKYSTGQRLSAPVKGKMEKDIFESITSEITVTLKKGKTTIFSDTSILCGLELEL